VLAKNITEAAKTMGQIATSSQQQLLGMDQVASAMESIRKITHHNVNGIRQLETTARNLQHVGQTLAGLLQQQNIYPTGSA
jgi:methyl-accepting chemotaxis protein